MNISLQYVKQLNKIYVLLLLLFFQTNLHSQDSDIDYLYQQLDKTSSDTGKINVLNQIAHLNLESNKLEEGKTKSTEALILAEQTNYHKGNAEALKNLGLFYEYNNQYHEAIHYYKLSYLVWNKVNDSIKMARLSNNVGAMYRTMASYDTAFTYFQKSLEILQNVNDSSTLAETYNLIGLIYNSKGNFEGSLEYLLESLNLYQCTNDESGMGVTYCNIGMIYRRLRDYEKALEFQYKAIDLDNKFIDKRPLIESYIQIGIVYQETAKYQKAIESYQKGLTIARKYNDKKKIAGCLNNIGVVYFGIKDYPNAFDHFAQSLEIKKQIGDKHGITVTTINLAEAYLDLQKSSNSLHQQSEIKNRESSSRIIRLLEESAHLAEETGNYQDLTNTYNALISASVFFNNYALSVKYQGKLILLNDSLFTIEKNSNLAKLQTQFDSKQKEQEIALLSAIKSTHENVLKKQDSQKHFYFWGGIALLVLLIGLLSQLSFMRITRNELQLKSEQIKIEEQRAEESQKIKDQFLANMSHEIRTPMNSIMGLTAILQRSMYLKSQEKYLNAIAKSSENLLVVVNDILDLSNLEMGKIKIEKSLFKLEDEMQKIEDILKYKAKEKGIKLDCVMEDGIPEWIIGDPTRLSQILLNLAGNAIKFTEEGKVTGIVRLQGKKGNIAILEFEIKDTGIGIPADRLDKIFDSFTQAYSNTNRQYGGTGLGLTISKELVDLQGGAMGVQSEVGKGSIFKFSIPYEIGESIKPKIKIENECKKPLEDLHVLVAEDNDFNVMVVSESLKELIQNVNLDIAENGKIALNKITENNFDLILMDIQMPVLNGYEATKIIRKMDYPKNLVPIIAMTANTMKDEVDKCYEAGMNEYIAKPFQPDDLANKIHSLVCNEKTKVK